VVLLRAVALYFIASGVIAWGSGLVLTMGRFAMPWLLLLIPIVGGILLWLLAKPFATLITKDLE
jgi:hypothetical protein